MIDELNLSGIELQVFAIIWSYSRGTKQMYIAGNSHLVRMTKKTEHTIITTLRKLQDKGYIQKIPVVVNKVERNYYKAISQGDEINAAGYCKNFSGGTAKISVPNIESNIESKFKDKTLSNDNAKSEDFEDFYKLYPLKKSKQSALKAWNKLSEKDKQAAKEKLLAYIDDCMRNKRSFKYPATYLNQRTWEDDFGTAQKIAFYDALETDTDEKKRFKAWMRSVHPEIENTALPLSYEDYMELFNEFGNAEVGAVLDAIEKDIYMYRKADIALVIRQQLREED